jgi:segregation and condensation protein A
MRALPQDLYIPPEALEVFLETFEGPLDLLLWLIRRHNLDVLDIPMAQLAKQYIAYVDAMQTRHFELAAEYLLMAAVLVEIKSRLLLPQPPADDAAEPEDPRAELVRRLLEYERIKRAAHVIVGLPQVGRDFRVARAHFERVAGVALPDVVPEDLQQAWLALALRAKTRTHHRVTREQLSVRERMSTILRRLSGARVLEFGELVESGGGIASVVVTFLALLELAREQLVAVSQQGAYAPIHIRLLMLEAA